MADKIRNHYLPDYVVTPGEVLAEYLESYSMTQTELATRTGLAKKTINGIIKDKAPITAETALKLERALGRPAHFWSNLERQYQDDKTRLEDQERLLTHLDWLKKVPVAAMAKLGWIAKHRDKAAQLEAVLGFFGIGSPEQWSQVWQECQVAYRQTDRFQAPAESVYAWLRKGEIEAKQLPCSPFDKKRFQAVLDDVRALTTKPVAVFKPQLIDQCARCGVAVVLVPELPKTGVYGATRWIRDKAVIQLSLRYKSNDHLWFTFFHEVGHILKHGRKMVFLEGSGLNGKEEKEANTFARDMLIPPNELKRFLERWDGRSLASVEAFSRQIRIAPGIVVGRLQFEKLLSNKNGNKLKVFYKWSHE